MKKHSQIVVLMAVTGFFLCASNTFSQDAAVTSEVTQPEFPVITSQPLDQAVMVGSNVTFTATVTNSDGYQWMRNGEVMPGETNSTLTLNNVSTNDVGTYTLFATKDMEAVPTRSANLNVIAQLNLGGGGEPFLVFGLPVLSGGGSGSCPGPYLGYVIYVKTAQQGWGWVPTSGASHSMTDTNRTDTKVEYVGRYGDHGCDQTTVSVPNPTGSPKYRFTVYFTNDVPTNPYAILLQGFNP